VGIFEMRRHYTNYLKGLPGIKDFRLRLVTLPDEASINEVLDEITEHYKDYEFERAPIEIINYHQNCPL
jgi:tRNA-dihydrouridine synthase